MKKCDSAPHRRDGCGFTGRKSQNFLIKIGGNGENTGQKVCGRSARFLVTAARISKMKLAELSVLMSLLKAQSVKLQIFFIQDP